MYGCKFCTLFARIRCKFCTLFSRFGANFAPHFLGVGGFQLGFNILSTEFSTMGF